ncbi:MAG: PAS sensor histidine kinase [uncultured archaeon A07HB70]|nr:MAG: PAS sensor histidine kinase [uncultured archaeon A07HB70]
MAAPPRQQIQVLHVDDDPEFAELTATFLKRNGDRLTVETAASADQALELIDDPPDCIVSDYNMPGMNGIELLRAVREEYPDLPFLLFTGAGSEAVAGDAISAGATDYLQKRSGTDQYELLANRIRNAVDQHRTEARLRETREEYAAVFENAQSGLLLVTVEDDGFRYRRCNPRAVELIGHDREDIAGQTPREAFGPENGQKIVGAYRACVERRDPVEYTVSLELPVGHVVRECQATPVTSAGEVEQLVVAFNDITERRQHKQALDAEQRLNRQALNALDDLFYVVDTDLRLLRWNDRVPAVTGYSDADLADMAVTELFPDDERETVAGAVETAQTGSQNTVEADLLTADGRRIPHEFTGAPLTDSDGTTVELVGVGRDLTERRQREQRFQTLVEESNDIISVVDRDGKFQYQSPSVERVLGYDPDETVGDTAWEYVHPDDRGVVRDAFEAWVTTQDAQGAVEYRARHADGSWRWMEADANNQLDNPAVGGLVVNSRDVTDRRAQEQELDAVTSQYQALIENFPDGAVYLFDSDLRYVRAGGKELSAVGLSADDIVGKQPHDLFPQEVADETVAHYRETLAGDGGTFEQSFGGEQYRVRTVPVRDDDGAVVYGMAVAQNVTERIEQRQALAKQNERLEEFTGIVSHDLRNPLSVAQGRIDLAREECESDHLDRAADAVDRSQALIDDLLTLAREDGTVHDLKPVALAGVAERSWQTVSTGTATLDVDATRAVRADRSRLRQLFENLYRNAVEHGGEDVAVRVGETDDGFYVADTGPGIPDADRDRVFDAGYSTADDGTGFGLRIVEQVVDAHGWAVDVAESERGGARIEITGVDAADG